MTAGMHIHQNGLSFSLVIVSAAVRDCFHLSSALKANGVGIHFVNRFLQLPVVLIITKQLTDQMKYFNL